MPGKSHRAFSIDDLWRIERLGTISLSPDGAQAVCTLGSHSMDDNSAHSALWLLSTLGGAPRRLTSCGEKDGQPAWSPGGDAIAFVARREQQGSKDDTPQLYTIAPDGGEARRASDFAPGVEAFKWFPDGRRIAFIAWVWPELRGVAAQARQHKAFKERKESGYATSQAQYRFWDHNLPMGRVAHLHVLDTRTGRVRDLFEGTPYELSRASPDAHAFDIAPDGRTICFAFDPQPRKQIDHCLALAEIDVKAGSVHEVAADAAWDFGAPRYSPDGRYIAFTASHQGKRHTMPAHLALLRRASKRQAPAWQLLSAQWDRSVNAPLCWGEDGDAIFFGAEDQGRCHLWRLGIASPEPAIVVRGGWLQAFDVGCASGVIVSVADASDHPARAHALHAGAAGPLRMETFNDALLAPWRMRPAEAVVFAGANGDPIQMWLTYPPGFDGAKAAGKGSARKRKTWPILHSIHGGPHAASGDTFHYRWNSQLFAAQGYVVAGVNYHGSSGFGHAFLDSITHRWGELELKDVEAGTDWLLAQPWADSKRVFATGGSYGGFMVAWMNAHVAPGRYNAYICHAGCFDWTAMFADDAYTWHAQEFGAWYWDDQARLDAQSPHAFAGTMRTPTLVIHGALDYRVPDAQGLAYYNTLQARGVDARLLWFPDENHWILKPRNSRMWHAEFFGWLKAHAG